MLITKRKIATWRSMVMKLSKQETLVLRETFIFHHIPAKDYLEFSQLDHPAFLRAEVIAGNQLQFPQLQENCIAIVISGKLTIHYTNGLPSQTVTEGFVIGAIDLFSVTSYVPPTIIADRTSTLMFITASQMRTIFEAFPEIMMRYINFLTGQLQSLRWEHSLATNASVEERLLQFLAQNARREKNTAVVTLPYSFSVLANRLHFSRATLYRVFDNMEENGFLRREGHTLTVLKPELLPSTDYV